MSQIVTVISLRLSIICIRHLLNLTKSTVDILGLLQRKNRFYSKVYFTECLDVGFYVKPAQILTITFRLKLGKLIKVVLGLLFRN